MMPYFIKTNSKITPYIATNKIMYFVCRKVTDSDVRGSGIYFDGIRYLPEVSLGYATYARLCDKPFLNRETCLEFISQVSAGLSDTTTDIGYGIPEIELECRKMECEVCGELIPQRQAETSRMFSDKYLCKKCFDEESKRKGVKA